MAQKKDIKGVGAPYLASLFGLTERRIRQLADDGIIPKLQHGLYPLDDSVRGYTVFLQEASRKGGEKNEDILIAQARYESARADKMEMEVALRRRELVLASDIETEVMNMVANFRARLLSLPSSIAAQGLGMTNRTEFERLVRIKVKEALYECARYDPQQTNDVEDTPKSSRKRKAATRNDSKRVGGRRKISKQ